MREVIAAQGWERLLDPVCLSSEAGAREIQADIFLPKTPLKKEESTPLGNVSIIHLARRNSQLLVQMKHSVMTSP